MLSYFDALLRYFEFSGRSSRAQYWLFELVYFVLAIAAVFADMKFSGGGFDRHHWGLFVTFVVFFHVVPGITVTVRRLHDIGKSGWWYLLLFVPFGGFWILYWTCKRSEDGPNEYGDPSGEAPNSPDRASAFGRAGRSTGIAQQRFAEMQARRSR